MNYRWKFYTLVYPDGSEKTLRMGGLLDDLRITFGYTGSMSRLTHQVRRLKTTTLSVETLVREPASPAECARRRWALAGVDARITFDGVEGMEEPATIKQVYSAVLSFAGARAPVEETVRRRLKAGARTLDELTQNRAFRRSKDKKVYSPRPREKTKAPAYTSVSVADIEAAIAAHAPSQVKQYPPKDWGGWDKRYYRRGE